MSMDAGLVGHWKFNEKSGITANDSSRYRNIGTLIGATHLPVWSDKGIKFDGVDDYVDAGNNPSLNITNAITVEAWFKKSGNVAYMALIAKGTYGSDVNIPYQIRWNGDVTALVFYISNGTTIEGISVGVTDANWHQVVGVVTETKVRLFLDGILKAEIDRTIGNISTTTNVLNIGKGYACFNGSIDEVRIYNRSLSANEIKRNYEATKHNYI